MTANYKVMKPGDVLEFDYVNHADKKSRRKVIFQGLDHGCAPPYYPTERWLLRTYDLEKGAARSFDLAKIDPSDLVINGVF